MTVVLDFLGALYELARLAILTRGRLRGAYWSWRLHTAFGRGYPPSKAETLKSFLDYGRWVYRMRRMR
jgi:hypothetical protein